MNTERSDFDRALRTWFEDGPTVLSDRVVDSIANRIARQPQRRTWRLQGRPFVNTYTKLAAAAAAVVIVGFVGWRLIPADRGPGNPPSPTPIVSATPSASPTLAPTTPPARMSVQGDAASWTAVIPSGWTREGGSRITASQGFGGPTGISIGASGAVNVPSDPCDGVGKFADATTPADVVAALEGRDDLVVSDPIDATLGENAGLRVDVEFPADLSACGDGSYFLFAEPDGSGMPALGPSNLFRIWIIDVDGRPVVFWIESFAGTPPDDLAEAQQIVDSIVITP